MTVNPIDRTAELHSSHPEFLADNAIVILTTDQLTRLVEFLEDVRDIGPDLNFVIERCIDHAPGYNFSWDNDGSREQDDRLELLIQQLCHGLGFFRIIEDPKPTVHRPIDDPLGYDTRRPIREVAREIAEDAIAGRHQDATDAELEAVRKRWSLRK